MGLKKRSLLIAGCLSILCPLIGSAGSDDALDNRLKVVLLGKSMRLKDRPLVEIQEEEKPEEHISVAQARRAIFMAEREKAEKIKRTLEVEAKKKEKRVVAVAK